MASGPRSQLSTLFEAMLAHNKERLDALLRGGRSAQRGDDADRAVATHGPSNARDAALDVASSAAARYLNERFANRWHYEIAEHRRVGDEAIVLCKLFLKDHGVVKTQFGRATIAAGSVAGRSGTVRFKLELSAAGRNEEEAYRHAAENALTNCVKLL